MLKVKESISIGGIVVGVLLILFGILTTAMLYFMDDVPLAVSYGPSIFVVIGGTIATYSSLTRETLNKYAMSTKRAILYSLAIGIILFSLFVACSTVFSTGEIYIAIGSFMIFFLIGIALLLVLILTNPNRKK